MGQSIGSRCSGSNTHSSAHLSRHVLLTSLNPSLPCSYLWLTIVYNVTYTVALYGLLLFYLVSRAAGHAAHMLTQCRRAVGCTGGAANRCDWSLLRLPPPGRQQRLDPR